MTVFAVPVALADDSKTHSVKTADSNLDWKGFYLLFED